MPEFGGATIVPAARPGLPRIPGYQVECELGRGGMGAVYKAVDTSMAEVVAIKTILPTIAANRIAIGRFRREATILSRLAHPYVVRSFGTGEAGDLLYTDRALGGTAQFIPPEQLTDFRGAGPAADQYSPAETIHYLLTGGRPVYHLTSPEENDGEGGPSGARIPGSATDGHRPRRPYRSGARQPGRERTESVVLGTPAYMSPEQTAGKSLTYQGRIDSGPRAGRS